MNQEQMTKTERRAALSLAGIYSFRMLGLFMILPVFALYAQGLVGATPALIGMAIGIYGLTQGVFQIPFGLLSDRVGRKPVITAGLLLFALGSVVAAMSTDIYGIIAGRALQGAGAIAAAIMALAADLTREEHRIKVNAIIGMSIGTSFSVAMVAGPVLDKWIGVSGIFWLTSVLAIGGILILLFSVPSPVQSRRHRDAQTVPDQLKEVVRDSQLLRLDFGIFTLHLVLTSVFVVVPLMLQTEGVMNDRQWEIYLPVMILAIFAMVPFIIMAEKKRRMKQVFVGAIAVLVVAVSAMMLSQNLFETAFALWLYFAAFNLLEASLPSLIAKVAPPQSKGTAMGVYSSAQFLGVFVGGAMGGLLHGRYGISGVFVFDIIVLLAWLYLAATMRSPRYLSSYVLRVGPVDGAAQARELSNELTAVQGVAEAVVLVEDGVAYLKVDSKALDEEALRRFSFAEGV
jgi:predicted MFS family arabinose efflux permease